MRKLKIPSRGNRATRQSRRLGWGALTTGFRPARIVYSGAVRMVSDFFSTRCKAWVCKRGAQEWLATPCNLVVSSGTDRSTPSGIVRIGAHTVDSSHVLRFHSPTETFYCAVCGMIGREQLERLHHPCDGPCKPRSAGRANLERLSKGLMPGQSKAAKAYNAGRVAVCGPTGKQSQPRVHRQKRRRQ